MQAIYKDVLTWLLIGSRQYHIHVTWLGIASGLLPANQKPGLKRLVSDSSCWIISLINSMIPERCDSNFKSIIFKIITHNSSLDTRCKIAPRWMLRPNEKSAIIQIMAWYLEKTNHYLSRCWPRSMSLHVITMTKWVNGRCPGLSELIFCSCFCWRTVASVTPPMS